jgi:hypothetical protein
MPSWTMQFQADLKSAMLLTLANATSQQATSLDVGAAPIWNEQTGVWETDSGMWDAQFTQACAAAALMISALLANAPQSVAVTISGYVDTGTSGNAYQNASRMSVVVNEQW